MAEWNYRLTNNMKFKSLFSFILVLFAISLQAQDLRIHVNKKGKVGFVDVNGNEVIKCQYESVTNFSNGVSLVTKSGKMGFIDQTGAVVLPLKYSSITPWNEFLYKIKLGKKIGLADLRGNIVLPVNYSHISKSNCYGKAIIALGGKATSYEKKTYMANAKYGIIDNKGNVLVEPIHKGIYEFTFDATNKYPLYENKRLNYSYWYTTDTLQTDCSYLGYSNNGFSILGSGIINGKGEVVLTRGLYDYVMLPQNEMVRYYIAKKKSTICGYHNLTTGNAFQVATFDKNINDMTYWSHGDFVGDIAPVNGTSWSFIDKEGKTLRSGYQSLKHSIETKLWAAQNNDGKWEVFDESNTNVPVLCGYEDFLFPTKEGDKVIFSVKKDGKYGCINLEGDTIIPFDYEKAYGNIYDVIPLKKDGKWGMMTVENEMLVPHGYIDLLFPAERGSKDIWVRKADSLYYHFNGETQTLNNVGYKTARGFKDGLAFVTIPNMKLEDIPIVRSQLYLPKTAQSTIDAADLSKYTSSYGYVVDNKGNTVMNYPVSTYYIDAVTEELKKFKGIVPTKTQQKEIILNVSRENRSYKIDTTISEEEWNY